MDAKSTRCGMLIKQINSELEKDANNSLRASNLTLSQISVLIELDETAEKKMSMKQMEKRVHVAQSTLAGVVKRLEEKGFVESMGSENDRRVKVIRITEKGRECCRAAEKSTDEAENRLLSNLTDVEKQILISLLKKVRDSFL